MTRLLPLAILLLLAGCAPVSHVLEGADGTLSFSPCERAPRCAVSLEDPGPGGDSVTALDGGPSAEQAHDNLLAVLGSMGGYRILSDDGRYVHAEFTTPLVRYKDDVEFLIRYDGTIDVRSAARIGWYDWETNRKRVEALRAALAARIQ